MITKSKNRNKDLDFLATPPHNVFFFHIMLLEFGLECMDCAIESIHLPNLLKRHTSSYVKSN